MSTSVERGFPEEWPGVLATLAAGSGTSSAGADCGRWPEAPDVAA